MITPDMLVFIITQFCGFQDKHISRDQKYECAEFFTNCSVVSGGYSTDKVVNSCKERWVEIERSRK
jgi:hypothetical protein